MAKIRIRGHESFMVREGWLSKGLICVAGDNFLFRNVILAAEKLEIGVNMVKSIRYWMLVFGLMEERKSNGVFLSDLGLKLLKYDCYLEDSFSLWLLHSNIAKNKEKATTWYIFFNKYIINEFSKEQLFLPLKRELITYTENNDFADGSLKSDIDILLNMYSKQGDDDDPEDKNRCPFARLGIIKNEGNAYIRQQPRLNRFNDYVILYELSCEFQDDESGNGAIKESVSIDKIAETAFNIYNLTRVSINTILDRLDNEEYIRVDRTAGLDVIYPLNIKKPLEVIEEYYTNRH